MLFLHNHFLLLIILKSLTQFHEVCCDFIIWDSKWFLGRTETHWLCDSPWPWLALVIPWMDFQLSCLFSPLSLCDSPLLSGGPSLPVWQPDTLLSEELPLSNLRVSPYLGDMCDSQVLMVSLPYCPLACVCACVSMCVRPCLSPLPDFELLEGNGHLICLMPGI